MFNIFWEFEQFDGLWIISEEKCTEKYVGCFLE